MAIMIDADFSDDERYCADVVRRMDEHRWLAVQYASLSQRRQLLALYALHWEIRQIPAAVSEPPLGEIRLQWWREALDEILAGGRVRAHPVVQMVKQGGLVTAQTRPVFEAAIDARAPLLYKDPFSDQASLWRWLDTAEGYLALLRAHLLGAQKLQQDETGLCDQAFEPPYADLIRAESAFAFAARNAGLDETLLSDAVKDGALQSIDQAMAAARPILRGMNGAQSALHLHLALTNLRQKHGGLGQGNGMPHKRGGQPFAPVWARLKLFQAMAFGAF